MKTLALFILLFITGTIGLLAQTKTLHDVYGGIELTLPPVMGNGMGRNDNVILFRPDGTFNHQMEKPDWQTRVTGKYTIDGQNIMLQYNGGAKDKFKLETDGDLDAGSYKLLKLNTFNSIPPGYYGFTSGSTSGGGSSGMVFVGTSGKRGLYFDGKGNFTSNRSSATMVSGDGIGGGTSSKDNGAGAYTISNGVLTLKYNSGPTETHSFFSRPQEKPIMAVVDGNIYFMDDDSKTADKTKTKSSAAQPSLSTNSNVTNTNTPAVKTTDVQSILNSANRALGGAKLDALKTLEVKATIMGINARMKLDLDAQKVRVELHRGQQLLSVEQLSNNDSWQWRNGRKSPLAPGRVMEMKQSLHSGPLAFRKENISRMNDIKMQPAKGDMTLLTYKIDGITNLAVFNSNNQLVGDGNTANRVMETSAYTAFTTVDGIVFPAKEVQTSGVQKANISYDNYIVNPDFTESDWNIPTP